MKLSGSCHCGSVRFTVESPHPYPYNRCYCSICRKTQGGGGYAINLGAVHETLSVEGADDVTVYRARDDRNETGISPLQRHFCRHCGSGLWCYDPRWPELVHPFASAIDTPLPDPPEYVHLMTRFKAPWCRIEGKPGDKSFPDYPDESLAAWHERLGLTR
ncbi:GFA family protein [Rhodospirillaceae bacterium KN72]|uniref:GFA family protein n=1 Tax=Pacificispira spongiicola TaxID=2729598 RepID=A0A7Y0E1G2_9PROT|nr:GFA family protein [Pacificispira spongiicola]NMM44686.1 GFA family protein [Pacificispira spongiicola]